MDCMRNGFEQGKLLGGRFVTIAPLNHGSFGMVFTARDVNTGLDVAIKCITKADTTNDPSNCPAAISTDERSEELSIHSTLPQHPNIVNLVHHFETDAHQYMVLQLCGQGDLYEAVKAGRGPLETEHVRDFMMELVNAVDHIHSSGVYHRDIKPENIFLTSDGIMKLGDFGLATTDTWSTEFAVGSDRYMAPEQYDASVYGYGYSPAAADVWAIGIVMLNVLFQRNPFAMPTTKDPLFNDFARDRQSLFDIFPKMSQDTYDVLAHSLALDPANRSLASVREALKAAVCFTTDDQSLDEFCTEQNDLAPVRTTAREPLRTPSITSPNMNGDSYPWSPALLKTPQKPVRQLSAIPEPELYPGSVNSEWQYVDTDEASLSSNVDSGLGMSYKSAASVPAASPIRDIIGSLPISFTKPATKKVSPYGTNSGFSKSWSDIWADEQDREIEMYDRASLELDPMDIYPIDTLQTSTPQTKIIEEDDCGSATPRPIVAEINANIRSADSSKRLDDTKDELPKARSSTNFLADKWAALGNFRRAKAEPSVTPTATPAKNKYSEAFSSFTFTSNKKQKAQPAQPTRSRERSSSWRQGQGSPERLRSTTMNRSQVWSRRDSPNHVDKWELDNNWREHRPPKISQALSIPSPPLSPVDHRPTTYSKTDKHTPLEDSEWIVGGWRDFHIN